MKIIFFLIAFCLIGFRIYFSWSGMDKEKRGESTSDMVIRADNFYEELKYSGKFQLNEDETAFKSISPGGYFKFIKNDVKVAAESSLNGKIEYRLYDGKNYSYADQHGQELIKSAVKEMVYQGFDADARMERIYLKGGPEALLNEMDSMRLDVFKIAYLKRLLKIDSLSAETRNALVKKIGSFSSDQDKTQLLNSFSTAQLQDQQMVEAYFTVIKTMHSVMDEETALNHLLDQDSMAEKNTDEIIAIAGAWGSDIDKVNFYEKMLKKGWVTGAHFDNMLTQITAMHSDIDKMSLYQNLMTAKDLSENQWIILASNISSINSDVDKSNLLIALAQKMPKTDNLKTAYLKTARTINNDFDYGKALRAIE